MNFWKKTMKKIYNFEIKTKPLSHQIEAIGYIKENENIALFDEQGLGKSKIVIDAMCYELEKKMLDCVLVICKKTLLHTWAKEVKKHTFLDYTILDGSRRQRGRSFMHPTKFYLINYEALLQELDRIKLFLGIKKAALVLDESQRIKNPSSKSATALLEIRNMVQKKVIITGSPLCNKPVDLWSQFYFLDGGATLGNNYNEFKRQFHVDLKDGGSLDRFNRSLALLREKITKVAIRRTKDILELPGKTYYDIFVKLANKQKRLYLQAKDDLIIEIKKADGDTVLKEIDNYLVKLLRLTQVASNPALINETYDECPAKFKKIDELVQDIIDKNEKVIVWSSFIGNIRALRNRYKKYGSVMLLGELSTEEKNENVDKFQELAECKVMVAIPAVASVGLTLTAANNVIYLDRNFKMDEYIQSQDRIHRIGQEKKCHIYKVLAKNTIDEYIDEIIEKKYLIAQYCLGDRDSISTEREFMTKEYILSILGERS